MNPSRQFRSLLAALAGIALLVAACGSDDSSDDTAADDGGEAPSETAPTNDDTSDDDSDDDGDGDDAPTGVAHPVISFAAHGPGAPNTYGPQCSTGIEATQSSLFRLTSPDGWVQRGSGGGTGASDMRFEVGDGEVIVDLAAVDSDLGSFGEVDFGSEVGEADLGGTTVPIVEVAYEERTGYAIDRVVWMTDLPDQFGGESAMTILVSSSDPALLTLDDATDLLSSVRVERCAAISDALIAASAGGVLAVPEFLDDPLGKTYPGGDQPAFDMAGAVNAWSTDQLAYLLPFPEPVDRCVAESLQEELPEIFAIGMVAVTAGQGDQQDALIAIADAC